MKLDELLNVEVLGVLVDQGYIKATRHPIEPLTIYNYTAKAQYERVWNHTTLTCRGLIVHDNGEVVARPFRKFFNLDEWLAMGESIPNEPPVIEAKLDGSLGILYPTADGCGLAVATRGSFNSDQAIHATKVLQERYRNVTIPVGQTVLVEIIYPQNRIVVDYHDLDDLIFLARIDNQTGRDIEEDPSWSWPGPVRPRLDISLAEVQEQDKPGAEGYVVRFPQANLRLKVKFPEYVRLHRLITQVSTKTLWEMLSSGESIEPILEKVPDEFYNWVRLVSNELTNAYAMIEAEARDIYEQVKYLPTRKDQALAIANYEHKAVVFKLLDGRPYDNIIWRQLKPAYARPFRDEGEEVG